MIDHPQSMIGDFGLTTNLTMVPIAAKVFGRLEDGEMAGFEFTQQAVAHVFGWPRHCRSSKGWKQPQPQPKNKNKKEEEKAMAMAMAMAMMMRGVPRIGTQ